MIRRTDITAVPIIAWPAPSPSSPEPRSGAPRGAGLDGSARPSTVAGHAVDASVSMYQNGNLPLHRNLLHKTSDTPLRPLPCSTRMTMRLLSMSETLSEITSDARRPAP